jgi:transcriptional regulator with XRE-family HTH domain
MKSATLRSKSSAEDWLRFARWQKLVQGFAEIRQQWGLSLREVERRSRSIARERRDSSFEVSASWIARLESDGHVLTVNTLIALAEIYGVPVDQRLRSNYLGNAEPLTLPSPSATRLPMEAHGNPNQTIYLRIHPLVITRLIGPRCSRKRLYRPLRHIGGVSSADLT